jgi:hypothetical protein
MGDKEGLTDEAKAEIQAAVKILREDGIHIHKTYDRYLKSRVDKDAETGGKAADAIDPAKKNDPPADPANPTPPPPPENPEPNEPPKKKGLWWGDKNDD